MNHKSPLYVPELHDQKETVLPDVGQIEQEIKSCIPSHFIPIYLDSKGSLDAPKLLHFPDYTMEDALNLNSMDDEDQAYAIVTTLNKMNFEKFDCSNLHPKELMQILVTLHATFISSSLEKEYYLNDTLDSGYEEGQIDHPSNISTVDLKIKQLKFISLGETIDGKKHEVRFKEPFSITTEKKYLDPEDQLEKNIRVKVKFRLSRMKDLIFAKRYCEELFHDESLKFISFRKNIKKLQSISNILKRKEAYEKLIEEDYDGWKNYQDFLTKVVTEKGKVIQASTIVGVGEEIFTTFEQKYEAYKNIISKKVWEKYDEVVSKYNFGLQEEVTFYSEPLKETITRRFSFRFTEFLSFDQETDSGGLTVSFD